MKHPIQCRTTVQFLRDSRTTDARRSANARRSGSSTIFMCILLAAMVLITGTAVDIIRWRMASARVEEAVRLTAESLLACADRPLREQYGLFALPSVTGTKWTEEASGLLLSNLSLDPESGAIDPFGLTIRNVEVRLLHNLSEPSVLRQQISEFMKLRAPLAMIQGFAAMLPAFSAAAEDSTAVNLKMTLERELAEVRETLVRIHVLDTTFLAGVNRTRSDSDLKSTMMERMESILTEAGSLVDAYGTLAGESDRSLNDLHAKWSYQVDQLNGIRTHLSQISKSLADAKAEWNSLPHDGSSEAACQSVQVRITRLESELSSWKTSEKRAKDQVDEARKKLEETLDTARDLLRDAKIRLAEILLKSIRLRNHIQIHRTYAEVAKEQCRIAHDSLVRFEADRAELQSRLATMESGVSASVRSDLADLAASADAQTYLDAMADLDIVRQFLDEWLSVQETFVRVVDADNKQLAAEMERLDSWLSTSGTPAELNSRLLLDSPDAAVDCRRDLSTLETTDRMGDRYPIPELPLEPAMLDGERSRADRWVRATCGSADESDADKVGETPGIRSIRDGMKTLADETAALFHAEASPMKEGPGPEETALIPSIAGSASSSDILAGISAAGAACLDGATASFGFDGMDLSAGDVDETEHGLFETIFKKVNEMSSLLTEIVTDGMDAIVEQLYVNEYVVSAFKCAATQEGKIPDEITWGRDTTQTAFDLGETEYVLFGSLDEATNLTLAKGSVWCVRFALNLIHVQTSPEKQAATLEAATVVSGWTLFGVPLVQNLLMIGWSAAESFVDLDILLKGETVPLVKTAATWQLDFRKLTLERFKGAVLAEARDMTDTAVDSALDAVEAGLKDTVQTWVDAAVDKAFEGVVANLAQAPEGIDDPEIDLTGLAAGMATADVSLADLDALNAWVSDRTGEWVRAAAGTLAGMGISALEGLKVRLKAEIMSALFNSPAYRHIARQVHQSSDELTGLAFEAFTGSADGSGTISTSQLDQVAGRVFETDYLDYMRLFLLMVPEETRLLRIADLLQMNMNRLLGSDCRMAEMQTAVHIRTEVQMKCWFAGWILGGSDGRMTIRAEWGQGY